MSPDHEAIAIGYTMTSTPRAGEILFTRTSDRATVRAPLVHDGFAWVDERRLLVRIGDPPRMHWAEFDGVTISLGAAAVRGLGRWTVGGSSGFDAGTGLVLLVGHPPTPTWPDGTGDIVTFVVPLSTLLARTEAGVALDAWADPEVTRLRNAQGGVVVGRRLVSMSSFGGLEVREIVSTSPPSFGPPRTIFVSTTHAIAALDDEHLVVEHAGTPWILRLAP
ncbi:MAG: hypothetical protein KF901_01575 [Myxococcales bacterium]|nr:hypothetical protein [Myxococcales bacterium]